MHIDGVITRTNEGPILRPHRMLDIMPVYHLDATKSEKSNGGKYENLCDGQMDGRTDINNTSDRSYYNDASQNWKLAG